MISNKDMYTRTVSRNDPNEPSGQATAHRRHSPAREARAARETHLPPETESGYLTGLIIT